MSLSLPLCLFLSAALLPSLALTGNRSTDSPRCWLSSLEIHHLRKLDRRFLPCNSSHCKDQDSNAHMVYWLSNTFVLLFLLQRTLKATGGKPPTPTSFFGRMTQGFRSSLSSANLSFCGLEVYQVEAKYPALLFKQQLTTYVEKIYGIVRGNSKKDSSPLLSSCIQRKAPM